MIIREATIDDLPRLVDIYNEVLRSSAATFDLEEQRTEWFSHYGGRHPLILGEIDGRVAGYASLSVLRAKPAYAATAESSVYVAQVYHLRGIGRALMKEILRRAAELGYHVALAVITAGNAASIDLHLELGFPSPGA